ncbi:hypothetical protein F4811DRAFT_554153 [Daldinia bambusicola]|nr:hypothetical protein F4811DRAFT_554153 [Daldinia bambusicola]
MELKPMIKKIVGYTVLALVIMGIVALSIVGYIYVGKKPYPNGPLLVRRDLNESSPLPLFPAPPLDLSPPAGTPLFNMSRPRYGSVPYGKAIFACANAGQVALTFDDGPDVAWTRQIAAVLDDLQVRGTFFVTGNSAELRRRIDGDAEYGDLLRGLRLRGHQVGSHTWTHRHLKDLDRAGRFEEMVYNEMALWPAVGQPPTYMRPPYGEWRDRATMRDLDALGYHVVMYNVDTKDYLHDSEEGIERSVERFKSALREDGKGSYIVLAHDTKQWTALKLLPAMVNTLIARGYKGVTVGECLNDEEVNWYRDQYNLGGH